MWCFNAPLRWNRCLQMSHSNLRTPVCVSLCVFNTEDLLNLAGQRSHWNGESAVWTIMCALRLLGRRNLFLQMEHSNGFTLVCISLWSRNDCRWSSFFLHTPHSNDLRLECASFWCLFSWSLCWNSNRVPAVIDHVLLEDWRRSCSPVFAVPRPFLRWTVERKRWKRERTYLKSKVAVPAHEGFQRFV